MSTEKQLLNLIKELMDILIDIDYQGRPDEFPPHNQLVKRSEKAIAQAGDIVGYEVKAVQFGKNAPVPTDKL